VCVCVCVERGEINQDDACKSQAIECSIQSRTDKGKEKMMMMKKKKKKKKHAKQNLEGAMFTDLPSVDSDIGSINSLRPVAGEGE